MNQDQILRTKSDFVTTKVIYSNKVTSIYLMFTGQTNSLLRNDPSLFVARFSSGPGDGTRFFPLTDVTRPLLAPYVTVRHISSHKTCIQVPGVTADRPI